MSKLQLSEKMSAVVLKDILSYGIINIPLGDGKQWVVDSRQWMIDLYKVVNPYNIERNPLDEARTFVCTKSTQAGVTTMALVRMLHFMTHWTGKVMYMMPRQKDVLDLVSTRLDPLLKASPLLNELRGQPDNTQTKQIGDSFVYFQEGTMEPRSIPIDLLFVDEVDLTDPANIGTATNRLDASKWALRYYLSTPTVNNFGIHKMWLASDMRKWLVKCPACNHEQEILWSENLRVIGDPSEPKRVFYGCVKCDTEITVEHIQTGRWVAERPELSRDIVGFHVHQMLTSPAVLLYKQFRDPLENTVEFHRKRLGMPYEIGGGSLDASEVIANGYLGEPYSAEKMSDGESLYYMGVDQGNQLQVLVAKIEPGETNPKIVHIELVNMDDGGFGRIGQLMNLYRVRKCVLDANPNRHSAIALATAFPERIFIADYNESGTLYTTKKEKAGTKDYNRVYIDRTLGFDSLIAQIRDGVWSLPGSLTSIPQDVHILVDQVTALKRDVVTRKKAHVDVQVPVYVAVRADHLGHSWSYLRTAIAIGASVKGSKIAIIQETDNEEDTLVLTVPKEDYKVIVSHLAEVKKDEIEAWLYGGEQPSIILSHKLSFLPEYDTDTIKSAIEYYILTN